jgi:antitoxin CcdA
MALLLRDSGTVREPATPRKSVNLTCSEKLLAEAKELGIPLSATFEAALAEIIAEHKRQQWLEENKEAIAAYNERVRKQGVFSDGLRRF